MSLLEEEKPYWKGAINFYYYMGYDCFVVWLPLYLFLTRSRIAEDIAPLSRGKCSWEEFEDFTFKRFGPKLNDLLRFFEKISLVA